MSVCTRSSSFLIAAALLCFAPIASGEVTFDWVTVGDPGNECDTQSQGCFGQVGVAFRMVSLEVTNADYVEFLNAVAATDTYALYATTMTTFGGITRSGSSGSYTYAAIAGRENWPVNYVSFWDATRFANWLHNGQPTGAQDNTTTEDGAYTLTPTAITNNTVTRNTGARFSVTSEDEWYKAAYYDPELLDYYDYPAGSNTQTSCTGPGATANTANCGNAVGDVVVVGSYPNSAPPYGPFDLGGNVAEWTEGLFAGGVGRSIRGGSFFNAAGGLAASGRGGGSPTYEDKTVGIRVASPVEAAAVPALTPIGVLMTLSLLGVSGLWRLRPSPGRARA